MWENIVESPQESSALSFLPKLQAVTAAVQEKVCQDADVPKSHQFRGPLTLLQAGVENCKTILPEIAKLRLPLGQDCLRVLKRTWKLIVLKKKGGGGVSKLPGQLC